MTVTITPGSLPELVPPEKGGGVAPDLHLTDIYGQLFHMVATGELKDFDAWRGWRSPRAIPLMKFGHEPPTTDSRLRRAPIGSMMALRTDPIALRTDPQYITAFGVMAAAPISTTAAEDATAPTRGRGRT